MSEDFPVQLAGFSEGSRLAGLPDRGPARGGRHGGGVPRARRAAYIYLAVALRQEDASSDLAVGLIPITARELLRDTVIPPARRDRDHRLNWSARRRRHYVPPRKAHRRRNIYRDNAMITTKTATVSAKYCYPAPEQER